MSIKINYKGNNVVLPFAYICTTCHCTCEIEQTRREAMRGRPCPEEGCDGELSRHITRAPSMGADYHDSLLTRNIGWDA